MYVHNFLKQSIFYVKQLIDVFFITIKYHEFFKILLQILTKKITENESNKDGRFYFFKF